ncbi:hypothetical protein ACFL4W_01895 [Planctomycetota bacterium]
MSIPGPAVRGLLLHISHYDPVWCENKETEGPFDLNAAFEIVDALSDHGFNTLVVDVADGVKFKSHPELKRPYSVNMDQLRMLAEYAQLSGIDVVPKLNFAISGRNLHDQWMRPYASLRNFLQKIDKYWKVAADLIKELVKVCEPERYFHIGMDEDHLRSLEQYVDAIRKLRAIIKGHKLRTVIWNDSCHYKKTKIAQVHADKCRAAEDFLPKDITQVLWDYSAVHPSIVKRIAGKGFKVWAAPGHTPDMVKKWRRAVMANGGSGLLMTYWAKCDQANLPAILKLIKTCGVEYGTDA